MLCCATVFPAKSRRWEGRKEVREPCLPKDFKARLPRRTAVTPIVDVTFFFEVLMARTDHVAQEKNAPNEGAIEHESVRIGNTGCSLGKKGLLFSQQKTSARSLPLRH